jgi:hypothetical protein
VFAQGAVFGGEGLGKVAIDVQLAHYCKAEPAFDDKY